MGGDEAIIEAARHCFQSDGNEKADENLLKMLVKEHHTSPMEHCVMTFEVKAPIFVFRQWHRHRIGMSYNELSLRYCEANPEFYIPDGLSPEQEELISANQDCCRIDYLQLRLHGLSMEQARIVLPTSLYSTMIWTCNMASLYHFLELRTDPHAQKEIREYAWAVCELAKEVAPKTMKIMEETLRERGKI